jgi:hypothetical protein
MSNQFWYGVVLGLVIFTSTILIVHFVSYSHTKHAIGPAK